MKRDEVDAMCSFGWMGEDPSIRCWAPATWQTDHLPVVKLCDLHIAHMEDAAKVAGLTPWWSRVLSKDEYMISVATDERDVFVFGRKLTAHRSIGAADLIKCESAIKSFGEFSLGITKDALVGICGNGHARALSGVCYSADEEDDFMCWRCSPQGGCSARCFLFREASR